MTGGDWEFIRRLAAEKGVTIRDAGVRRTMRLGYAIDCILDTHERNLP